jgi:hypothetical protein
MRVIFVSNEIAEQCMTSRSFWEFVKTVEIDKKLYTFTFYTKAGPEGRTGLQYWPIPSPNCGGV